MASSLKALSASTRGSESLIIAPYIGKKETADSRNELIIGFRLGDNMKYELAFGSYMVKRTAPDGELNYGLKVFGRTQDSEIEIGGIELQIYDHRQVVIYQWVHENIGKVHDIDFNDAVEWVHKKVTVHDFGVFYVSNCFLL